MCHSFLIPKAEIESNGLIVRKKKVIFHLRQEKAITTDMIFATRIFDAAQKFSTSNLLAGRLICISRQKWYKFNFLNNLHTRLKKYVTFHMFSFFEFGIKGILLEWMRQQLSKPRKECTTLLSIVYEWKKPLKEDTAAQKSYSKMKNICQRKKKVKLPLLFITTMTSRFCLCVYDPDDLYVKRKSWLNLKRKGKTILCNRIL